MPVQLIDEIILDPNIFGLTEGGQVPISGSPEFANTMIRNPGTGFRHVNVTRFDPQELLSVDLKLLSRDDCNYLIDFWRGGYGSGYGFRVRVPHDWRAVGEVFAGPGGTQAPNGVMTAFKLYKTYARPGTIHPDVRRIIKPVVAVTKETNAFQLTEANGVTPRIIENPFKIYFGATEQTTGWTVNAKTGIVTFAVAPPTGTFISWSGEFDVPMQFLENRFSLRFDVIGDAAGLTLAEILPSALGIV